ncbi:MAG: substrate-binding domain-containing protein [Bacteroidetes bacterium]|nr:substrate-binding domain-containing protein [Bacteroidota bacterium]
MKILRLKNFITCLTAGIFLASCGGPNKPTFTDTPTSGSIVIVSDDSYQPLVSTEADTFMGIYRQAKVRVKYFSETEAFKELVNNDSVRLIVSARELNDQEKEYFKSRNLFPRITKIAIDAVAVIINNENPDTLFKYNQLGEIISGKISTWKQVNKNHAPDSIRIVFDRNGSANTRYLKEKFLGKNNFPANCYATNSNAEVVDYVSRNKNALGIISMNWISDKDDPSANGFLQKIRVAEISPPDTSKFSEQFFKPYQGFIALKQYPLIRNCYIISREGRSGLGTGFAAFVAGDQGQRIVRLMGMLPATMPVRLIHINQ